MSWFTRKTQISNVERAAKARATGVSAFYSGELQRCIDLLLEAINLEGGTPTTASAEEFLYVGIAEMQLYDRDKNPERLKSAEGVLLMARTLTVAQGVAPQGPLLIAWTLDERNFSVVYNLGTCYIKQQRYQEAEECFLDIARLKPNADVLLKLGFICHKTGRKQGAVAYWQQVLTIDPENNLARQNLENAERYY